MTAEPDRVVIVAAHNEADRMTWPSRNSRTRRAGDFIHRARQLMDFRRAVRERAAR